MWRELGALGDDVRIERPEVLFTIDHNGEQFCLYRDLDKTINRMLEMSPEDAKEIKHFKQCVDTVHGYLGTYGPDHNQKLSYFKMLKFLPGFLEYVFHSTGEISKKFKNETLSMFFGNTIGRDFGAFALAFIVAAFTIDNADVPAGLSGPLAERMADKLKELGGTLLLNKEAVKINVENGKAVSVTFKDGETIEADYIITALEPNLVFGKMLDAPMPKEHEKLYKNPKFKRFSSYHVQFACDSDYLDFSENIFLEVPEDLQASVGNRRIILREFSREESFTKDGKLNLQAMIYCNEENIMEFLNTYDQGREAYLSLKQKKADAVCEVIERRFPEYAGKLTVLDTWTPATYRRYTGAEYGTYQSFITPKKHIPHRVDNRVKGIENLILASQWQMSPGGLPVAASNGIKAISTIREIESK